MEDNGQKSFEASQSATAPTLPPPTYGSGEHRFYDVKTVADIFGVPSTYVVRWTIGKRLEYDEAESKRHKRFIYAVDAVKQAFSEYRPETWNAPDMVDDTPPEHIELETYIQLNKLNALTLDNLDIIPVTKYSNSHKESYRKPSRVVCPFCGSWEMEYYEAGGATFWKCDCLGKKTKRNDEMLAAYLGLDPVKDRDEIFRRVKKTISSLGERHESFGSPNVNVGLFAEGKTEETPPPLDDYARAILEDLQKFTGGFENLSERDKRGLKDETAEHFDFRAADDWNHPKMKSSRSTPRIIIPLGAKGDPPAYNAILTPSGRQKFSWATGQKKNKWADKCLTAGAKLLFNPSGLAADIVSLTEGEIDAASIWQAMNSQRVCEKNVDVCALGGAGIFEDLKKRLRKLDNKPWIVIFFDRDSVSQTGQINSAKLVKELTAMKVPAVERFFDDFLTDDEKKHFTKIVNGKPVIKVDANDILIKLGDEKLREIATRILSAAVPELAQLAERFRKKSSHDTGDEKDNPKRAAASKKNSPPDIDIDTDEIKLILKDYVKASQLDRQSWWEVGAVMFRYGLTLDDFKAWSDDGDPRYSPEGCQAEWNSYASKINSLGDKGYKIGTLIELAKQNGYAPEKSAVNKMILRLKSLQAKPPTPERNEEMRVIIRDMCDWRHDKEGFRTTLKPTVANMKIIFKYDPCISNMVGYDTFQQMPVYRKLPMWKTEEDENSNQIGKEWTDLDDSRLRIYLREHYGELKEENLISQYFDTYCIDNSFNLVRDYLNGLPKWDGVKRAEELFIKYLRVADTPYARAVTKNWLIAAVARIFHPGCRYQTALVLQGNQGIGKSYISEMLGGKFYSELTDNVEDPHAIDAIQNTWICEIKEMAALGKAAVNAIKAFIDRSEENRRFAYLRRTRRIKRHCIFAITINDKQFLRDWTGNRRYMILECGSEQSQYVKISPAIIPQIWAEVLVMYKQLFQNGFDAAKLELPREIQMQAEQVAGKFMQDDGTKMDIESYLNKKIPPWVIWKLLSKEQRKEFISKGNLLITQEELNFARRALGGRDAAVQKDIDDIDRFLRDKNGALKKTIYQKGEPPQDKFLIFGTEYRQHICPGEIYHEAFNSGDKRRVMYRIQEILPTIAGWGLGVGMQARLQKYDREYYDQKTVYWRDGTNFVFDGTPDDNSPDKDTKPEQNDWVYKSSEEIQSAVNSSSSPENDGWQPDEDFLPPPDVEISHGRADLKSVDEQPAPTEETSPVSENLSNNKTELPKESTDISTKTDKQNTPPTKSPAEADDFTLTDEELSELNSTIPTNDAPPTIYSASEISEIINGSSSPSESPPFDPDDFPF